MDEAFVPAKAAVVEVAPADPLNAIWTDEPTGTFVPRTTTGMGSGSWLGRMTSIVEKLEPEYDGTGYPPTDKMVKTGGFAGTIAGLIVVRTGAVPLPVYVKALRGASSLTMAAVRPPLTLIELETRRIAPFAPVSNQYGQHPPDGVKPPFENTEPSTVILTVDAMVIAPPPDPPGTNAPLTVQLPAPEPPVFGIGQ